MLQVGGSTGASEAPAPPEDVDSIRMLFCGCPRCTNHDKTVRGAVMLHLWNKLVAWGRRP